MLDLFHFVIFLTSIEANQVEFSTPRSDKQQLLAHGLWAPFGSIMLHANLFLCKHFEVIELVETAICGVFSHIVHCSPQEKIGSARTHI